MATSAAALETRAFLEEPYRRVVVNLKSFLSRERVEIEERQLGSTAPGCR